MKESFRNLDKYTHQRLEKHLIQSTDLLLKIADDCLNLCKINLEFELKSNFEVHKLDISKLKKNRVELDYYKNQVQIDRRIRIYQNQKIQNR